MKPLELTPDSKAKVATALAMVAESDKRMNRYTEAQRAELERGARFVMRQPAPR